MDKDIKECIEMFDIEVPFYVKNNKKSISQAFDDKDINLVKSILAYKNHMKNLETKLDGIIYRLSK
jgi:hypothetical protein